MSTSGSWTLSTRTPHERAHTLSPNTRRPSERARLQYTLWWRERRARGPTNSPLVRAVLSARVAIGELREGVSRALFI